MSDITYFVKGIFQGDSLSALLLILLVKPHFFCFIIFKDKPVENKNYNGMEYGIWIWNSELSSFNKVIAHKTFSVPVFITSVSITD